MNYVFIGDIAGEYDTLMALVAKCPADSTFVLLGDMVDRGPKSRQVVEWAMNTPNVIAIKGNHEDLMVDQLVNDNALYPAGIWVGNGGGTTIQSYQEVGMFNRDLALKHCAWLNALPDHFSTDEILATHAPYSKGYLSGSISLWNRSAPERQERFLINGHNSNWGLAEYKDAEGVYGISIDTSGLKILSAYVYNDHTVIQQEYIYVD